MKNTSYADEIAATKVILAGLKANAEKLAKRGIDDQFLAELEGTYNQVLTLDNEQETLKAKLKEKSAILSDQVSAMQKLRSEAKKLVKLEIPQTLWREFGIEDKK